VEEILNLAIGPAGSVAVLLLVLFAVWKAATAYIFPLLKEYLADQQRNFRDLLDEHREDRKVFTAAIKSLTDRQDKFEGDIHDIKVDIKQIKERF
jgi:hypothetical protein